jgi:hypothetical protein
MPARLARIDAIGLLISLREACRQLSDACKPRRALQLHLCGAVPRHASPASEIVHSPRIKRAAAVKGFDIVNAKGIGLPLTLTMPLIQSPTVIGCWSGLGNTPDGALCRRAQSGARWRNPAGIPSLFQQ